MHFLGHSTVRVELAGHTVLTDPLLTGRVGPLRRVVPPPGPEAWAGVGREPPRSGAFAGSRRT